MSDLDQANGHHPQRISFGAKEWESLQPDVASMLLTLFKRRQPALFGAYLAEVYSGVKPKAARGD